MVLYGFLLLVLLFRPLLCFLQSFWWYFWRFYFFSVGFLKWRWFHHCRWFTVLVQNGALIFILWLSSDVLRSAGIKSYGFPLCVGVKLIYVCVIVIDVRVFWYQYYSICLMLDYLAWKSHLSSCVFITGTTKKLCVVVSSYFRRPPQITKIGKYA